jgi:hypothetical protein
MEPNLGAALDAAKENSFLARLSLLDPRTLDPVQAEKIGDLLDAGAGEGGKPSEAGGPGAGPGSGPGTGPGSGDAGHGSPGGPGSGVGEHEEGAKAIHDLLRQLVYVDPNANMLANGVRPLSTGSRLSLHSSRVTALQFPMWVRGDDDSVVSSRGKLSLGDAATKRNPFYDSGVVKYYLKAGGASPPTPFSGRKVLAAAVWYV